MQVSRIKLLLIISSLVLIAVFAYFFIARRTGNPPPSDTKALIESVQKQPSPAAPQAAAPAPSPASNAVPAPAANRAPASPPDPLAQLRSDLEQLSRVFAERWGSYSNQQDISNIRTLLPFMTAAMQTCGNALLTAAGASKTGGINFTRDQAVERVLPDAIAAAKHFLSLTEE